MPSAVAAGAFVLEMQEGKKRSDFRSEPAMVVLALWRATDTKLNNNKPYSIASRCILADGEDNRRVWLAQGDGSPVIERRASRGQIRGAADWPSVLVDFSTPGDRVAAARCTGEGVVWANAEKSGQNRPGGSAGTASLATATGGRHCSRRWLTPELKKRILW